MVLCDLTILSSGENSVVLLSVLFMSHSMKTEFPSLSKTFLASVDSANERLYFCVNMHVLLEILLKCKTLATKMTLEVFYSRVSRIMSSKCELGAVFLETVLSFTYKFLAFHFLFITINFESLNYLNILTFLKELLNF